MVGFGRCDRCSVTMRLGMASMPNVDEASSHRSGGVSLGALFLLGRREDNSSK